MKINYYKGNGTHGFVRHCVISFNHNHWIDIQITPEFAIWGFWKDRNYTLIPKPKWWQKNKS